MAIKSEWTIRETKKKERKTLKKQRMFQKNWISTIERKRKIRETVIKKKGKTNFRWDINNGRS